MSNRTNARRLPLDGLLAFDAILRLGTFARAAQELGVTPSAVSHRLKSLERRFGGALLIRHNPGLQMTAAGEKLERRLAPLLVALDFVNSNEWPNKERPPFRLAVGQALLTHWLSPRLPALTAAFPKQPIEIVVIHRAEDAKRRDIDLALIFLPRADATAHECMLPFPDETVFPVAAPALLAANRDPPDPAWRKLALIDKRAGDTDSEAPEWSWRAWSDGAPLRKPALLFRDSAGSLQAALEGQGAALTRSLLAADGLRLRRLSALVPLDRAKPCSKVQIARWHFSSQALAPKVAAWLRRAAQDSLRDGLAAPASAPADTPRVLRLQGAAR